MRFSATTAFILVIAGLSCSRVEQRIADNTLTDQEKKEGWMPLFDGQTANGWRGFNATTLPPGWAVDSGMFTSLGKRGDTGGDVIYAARVFANFELTPEWKLSKGGNSGVFYDSTNLNQKPTHRTSKSPEFDDSFIHRQRMSVVERTHSTVALTLAQRVPKLPMTIL